MEFQASQWPLLKTIIFTPIGYGVAVLRQNRKWTQTPYSVLHRNSKALHAAALGILVDEKKLKWNDRVIDYIPEFNFMIHTSLTKFTITDLLTHRSGMAIRSRRSDDLAAGEQFYTKRYYS